MPTPSDGDRAPRRVRLRYRRCRTTERELAHPARHARLRAATECRGAEEGSRRRTTAARDVVLATLSRFQSRIPGHGFQGTDDTDRYGSLFPLTFSAITEHSRASGVEWLQRISHGLRCTYRQIRRGASVYRRPIAGRDQRHSAHRRSTGAAGHLHGRSAIDAEGTRRAGPERRDSRPNARWSTVRSSFLSTPINGWPSTTPM